MNRKNSALRVAFLTDWQFGKLTAQQQQEQKRRALRLLMKMVRYPVVENSHQPDVIFRILRQAGSKSWMLRKVPNA